MNVGKTAPALAAGNTVVLKPAPDTLIHNATTYVLFAPDVGNPTLEQVAPVSWTCC
jgi:acyl-CoA reductase-like NAD-dependent aldehyde dehydrogenase